MFLIYKPALFGKWVESKNWPLPALAILLIISLLLAGCGLPSSIVPGTPSGWHDISPPSPAGEATVSAYYAISSDVPGLIVACLVPYHPAGIGGPEDGPTSLWQTHDDGRSWHKLPNPPFTSSCKLFMPNGGNGLIFVDDWLNNHTLYISHDAGNHWSQMQLETTAGDPTTFLLRLENTVYRNGEFYKIDSPASGPPTMAVSADNGQSWTDITTTSPTPPTEGAVSIAPDYHASGAWYRLAESTTSVIFEHSTDGGYTWQHIQTLGLMSGSSGFLGTLATTPTQPDRICASNNAVNPLVSPSGTNESVFAATSDGGHTWNVATVAKHPTAQVGSGAGVVYPGIVMDPQGNCYLADQFIPTSDQLNVPGVTTFWRFAPGSTRPQQIAQLQGATVALGIDTSPNGASSHLVVAEDASGSVNNSCLEWAK
jgi:hypothetical protein